VWVKDNTGTELSSVRVKRTGDICGIPICAIVQYVQSEYIHTPSGHTYLGNKHGGGGAECPSGCFVVSPLDLQLSSGEILTGIYGRAGAFVDSLQFVTSRSNYSSFDEIERAAEGIESGGNPFFLLAPPGYKIREWFGRSGAAVDAIGIIAEPEPALSKTGYQQYKLGAVGGWGGEAFADQEVAPLAGISKIKVTDSCYVYRVKFEYSDGGKTDMGDLDRYFVRAAGASLLPKKNLC
jgi:hypothetical protein